MFCACLGSPHGVRRGGHPPSQCRDPREGRAYRATADMLAFVGYYQGAINVTDQKGDLRVNAASLTCPGIQRNTATKTTEGAGAASSRRRMVRTSMELDVHRQTGCRRGGTFLRCWGTGKFTNASGQGEFMMTSTLAELEATLLKKGKPANPASRGSSLVKSSGLS